MEQNPTPVPPVGGPQNSYEQVYQQPAQPMPEEKKGFAITALVLGIVSIVGLCCCIGVFTAPFAVIFGIVALAKKQGGKGMSITGIVLGGLTLLITIATVVSMAPLLSHMDEISEDMVQLMQDQDEVFPAYEKDGTLPDYLLKYKEPPYSEMLENMDVTIYDVMDSLLAQYKAGTFPRVDGTVTVSGAATPAFALPLLPAGT